MSPGLGRGSETGLCSSTCDSLFQPACFKDANPSYSPASAASTIKASFFAAEVALYALVFDNLLGYGDTMNSEGVPRGDYSGTLW
ncbi:hypothetical protein TMatcc_002645 [Talaromyces marneffei ATCC 18224]